jgi:hypothetical protein
LLVRINQLEHELAYFKKLADEVYLWLGLWGFVERCNRML